MKTIFRHLPKTGVPSSNTRSFRISSLSPSSKITVRTMAQNTDQSPISSESLLEDVKRLIPELTAEKYKGQAGKVAVIGGCREYTGAPYFASYSALKAGADLAHVFCTEGAATVIKCYSPELIVHPYLPTTELSNNTANTSTTTREEETTLEQQKQQQQQLLQQAEKKAVSAILDWLDRFDVLLVGPGLGRESHVLNVTYHVIAAARDRSIPIVVDADGLWLLNKHPKLVQGYSNAVITPNIVEFQRLASVLGVDYTDDDALERVCRELGGPVVVQKGAVDKIMAPNTNNSSGEMMYAECSKQGSFRRAGGQGDVLSGCIATFIAWARRGGHLKGGDIINTSEKSSSDYSSSSSKMLISAAYGGCLVTRLASRAAFEKHGRAMGASDVIAELGKTVDSLA